jgi:hypothetical protein
MTIEQFFKNPLQGIEPIGSEIRVRELQFGFEAVKFINYDYGYKFEIGNLLGFDIEHLNNEMRTHWGFEPNVNQN